MSAPCRWALTSASEAVRGTLGASEDQAAHDADTAARDDEDNTELEDLERRYNEFGNYDFEKIKILPGNVGYLKFNSFQDASIAGPTAVAAMNFLAHTDALIIDLRDNGGGSPSLIQLITTYFFECNK